MWTLVTCAHRWCLMQNPVGCQKSRSFFSSFWSHLGFERQVPRKLRKSQSSISPSPHYPSGLSSRTPMPILSLLNRHFASLSKLVSFHLCSILQPPYQILKTNSPFPRMCIRSHLNISSVHSSSPMNRRASNLAH